MVTTLYLLLKTFRPRQWLKNLAVYAALVFSGFFFYDFPSYFLRVTATFILFSMLSSAIYVFNDLADRESDSKHPFKRKRPLASGKLSPTVAAAAALGLGAVAALGGLILSPFVFVLMMSYAALQISYSLVLKHISILDVLSIAGGFMIRVYAGSVVVNLHMSVWFLLTVISVSLFIAVAKRQSERTLLSSVDATGKSFSTRKALNTYSQRLLDIYTGMFATAAWVTYALFAFQQESEITTGMVPRVLAFLPRAFSAQKWLMLTVPLTIYGVMRYLQLVYESNEGESPERVLLRDKALLAAAVVWGVLVMIIIYGLE
jgi:4-hydroxybenzoate polyprenyltransferase